jgi:ribose transport system substrate-binding protein
MEAVLNKHPEITIADRRFAAFQEDKAKAVMTDLVRRYSPGEIRAVVAQSDEMAVPAAEVVKAAGWKETLVFGFDGSRTAFESIRGGGLSATILQDPLEQGKKAIEVLADHLRGQHLDPEIITPLRMITRSNVDQFQPAY